jgi:hypothetical protein
MSDFSRFDRDGLYAWKHQRNAAMNAQESSLLVSRQPIPFGSTVPVQLA